MTFALAFQFYVYLPLGAFNQEKALVGAFSVIVQPVVEPMEHYTTQHYTGPVSTVSCFIMSA